MEVREDRDTKNAAAKAAEQTYREVEADLHAELEDSPLTGTIKLDVGEPYGEVVFQPKETYYGRVIDSDAALEYFEERALLDEFTEPKIVGARVNEIVRERVESGEAMPPGLDYYAKRFISITRKKA